MPPSKGPVPQDAIEARRILIGGLAGGADILALVSQLAPQHPGNDTFLCGPKTSSTSCDQAIFVNQATDASLLPDATLAEVDWLG